MPMIIELPMEDIIKDFNEGMTLQDLGSKYYCDASTIKRHLKKHGAFYYRRFTGPLGKDVNPIRKVDPEEIRRLYYEEKKNSYEIANMYGVSNTTVINYMAENGIERRARGKRERKMTEREITKASVDFERLRCSNEPKMLLTASQYEDYISKIMFENKLKETLEKWYVSLSNNDAREKNIVLVEIQRMLNELEGVV